jgi:hypothetical protein
MYWSKLLAPSSGTKRKPRKEISGSRRLNCVSLCAGFLFGLLFDPEVVGDMFLRNVRPGVITQI